MLTPFLSILAALVDGDGGEKAALSELRQRLGATPAVPAIAQSRLAGLATQYGQRVVDALVLRIRQAGLDPFEDADLARLRSVLPFLARTIARPEDPSGALFSPQVPVDLLDLAAASEGQDLLASPSWPEVLRQLHRDQAAALRHLESLARDQQFVPDPNGDPVQARVLTWLRRLSLRHALPNPAPNIEWITDWVRGAELPPHALEVYGPEGAIAASAAWHNEPATDLDAWTTWRTRVETAKKKGWRPSPGVPVRTWDNGWSLQSLGPTQLKDESDIMGHCVGDANQHYARDVTKKDAEIWSLRDPDGYPVATMEIRRERDGGEVTMRGGTARITGVPQVRGPHNRTMHPSHRRYLWDTFQEHIDLLPNSVQIEVLGQFLHRGTADFHRVILSSPRRALEWAATVDKRSLPDTREAALRDPDTAVRWMELLDKYLATPDTLEAAERDPKAFARYLDVVKKDEASPGLKLLIDRVSTAAEGAELRTRLRSESAKQPLDERFADNPRYLSRIYGLSPRLSPETWQRIGLAPRYQNPATRADAEAADDAKVELIKAITLRDPYATLRASVNGGKNNHGDTPERAAAVLGDALAAAAYANLHHPYRDEAYPFWEAILHAPIGELPDAGFLVDLKANSGGFNSGSLTGLFAPKIPATRARAALVAVIHARKLGAALSDDTGKALLQQLLALALTLSPDDLPETQALLYVLWPRLLEDPANLARLRTEPVMLALAKIFDSSKHEKADPVLTALFRPGGPLRATALRYATDRPDDLPAKRAQHEALLSFLALHVDAGFRPDVVRLFFRNGTLAALGALVPLVLDPLSGLSPQQRRDLAFTLPHPHQFPGYAWAGNVPEEGRGRSVKAGTDVAGLWQDAWIKAQISDRIARLRAKVRTRPIADRRAVEEGIQGVADANKVGQAQSRAMGWGYKQGPFARFGDPKMDSSLGEFRELLARYRVEDLHGVDGGLEVKGRYGDSTFTAWPYAEAVSGGPLPIYLYYGLSGAALSAYATLVAPMLKERTLYNAPAFGDVPGGLHGGLRLESPELATWMERLDRLDPKAKKSFETWSGLVARSGLPSSMDTLRVLFLAATPHDAELATEAAVIIPVKTAELPLLGWIPWTTPTGAAGWLLLFRPKDSGQVSFEARAGALTRTAPRPDPG